MKNYGRMVLRALVLGGTIATGFIVNSTNSMAAEIETPDAESAIAEVHDDNQEEQNKSESIRSMEDAVGVIEGDAVAEEGYLTKAQESINNNDMTAETAEEVMNGGTAVMEQAKEKKKTVDSIYHDVTAETDEAKSEFSDAAKDYDLAENVNKVESADNDQEKIDIVNDTFEQAEQKHEEFADEHGVESEEYTDVENEITDWSVTVEEAKAEYDKLAEYYAEVNAKYQEVSEIYNNYGSITMDYLSEIEDLRQDIRYANRDLMGLHDDIVFKGEDYAQAVNSLNEVFEDLKDAERRLEEAAARLKEMTDTEYEDEYSIDLSDYESELENYNQTAQLVNEHSENVRIAKEEYEKAKEIYSTESEIVKEKEKKLDALEAEYDQWLEENPYEEVEARYEETGSLVEEADKNLKAAERSVKLKNGYLDYLNKKKNDLDLDIEAEAQRYNTLYNAISRYIVALNTHRDAEELKNQAEVGFAKTNEYYQELQRIVDEYNANSSDTDIKALYEAAKEAAEGVKEDLAEEEAYYDHYKKNDGYSCEGITIGEADNIQFWSPKEDAKKNNTAVRECYEKIKAEVDKNDTEVKYNTLIDIVADNVLGLQEINDATEQYMHNVEEFDGDFKEFEEILIDSKAYIEAVDMRDREDLVVVPYSDKSIEEMVKIRRTALIKQLNLMKKYGIALSNYSTYISDPNVDKELRDSYINELYGLQKEIVHLQNIVDDYVNKMFEYCDYYRYTYGQSPYEQYEFEEHIGAYTIYIFREQANEFKHTVNEYNSLLAANREKVYNSYLEQADNQEIVEKITEYKEQLDLRDQAKELITSADKDLSKIDWIDHAMGKAVKNYYSDVNNIDTTFELIDYEDGKEYTIKGSFVGRVKGNIRKIRTSSTVSQLMNNLIAASGDLNYEVIDENGVVVNTVCKTIDEYYR
ncbi:hypothetical protein SAMN04487831_11462 [Pseudobutyrivibrio sp. UC1225]|uniref:hypothetical protein n=1 Tax=Pseudobutyrivibrio sp. UC1225 TaxID=1798185 RepID=UPI0008E20842|nr:hypothetical protein [Pseudobutyrivibrio sp. UC1225]SFO25640.1 hypothetical protein SAMN04487831_11462 [Pseudobutyrivibrio sp. UC1225]